ncbi:MAG: PfkB family carbohydrate kinase [Dissulfurispiraceae bacterium]|jgi:sulfofructose kinase
MKIVGVGQCSLDYLALVDSFPETDTKSEVLFWVEQGGGPVATALVTLARLGAECAFYGVVGDDTEGDKIRQSLIDERVEVGGVVRHSNAGSQKAFIVIEKSSGKRTIFWKRPSGSELEPDELGRDFLIGADFLVLDGLMYKASLHAVRMANALNVPVMLDAGSAREGMIDVARLCNYVVASEKFAKDIGYDGDAVKFASVIRKLGFGTTTVTLGEKGSITFRQGEIILVSAYEVEAADTTGAGDVFHGGYVYGILKKWDIRTVVCFASAMAAMKCRMIGGRAGIPALRSVKRFLKVRGFNLPVGRS